jgi:(p)ppGpp synthase/HD superfamily hydrolase
MEGGATMSTLDRAILIAAQAHLGQVDRVGEPYVLHPLRVMMAVGGETERTVAALHDVVEDSEEWTLDRLREEGFSEEVVEAVDHLTRREGETYEAFVERASGNPIARRVKLADLADNMDIRRLKVLGEKEVERLRRYHAAWNAVQGNDPTREG